MTEKSNFLREQEIMDNFRQLPEYLQLDIASAIAEIVGARIEFEEEEDYSFLDDAHEDIDCLVE